MQAIQIDSFGDPSVLKLKEVETAQPGRGEVLVRVHAAGVNPVDYKIRQGHYPRIQADQLPLILGRDVCGVVERSEHDAHPVGEEVFALLDWRLGGYAEYAAIAAAACVPKPRSLSHCEAGAVPLAALTAWQGLFDHGGLRAGQQVLIHAGAGGVGHFAVQFARVRGARVAATAAGGDLDFVRELGATLAIDYRAERFEDRVRDVDLVLDLVGGETRERSFAVLKRGGTLVSTLGQPDAQRAAEQGIKAVGYLAEPNAAQLREIGRLLDAGEVRVQVSQRFPLAGAADAHRCLEEQHPRGKVVLVLAE
jgi:NADPH:quinone reductase-like Zn-dependent oxidoreductase